VAVGALDRVEREQVRIGVLKNRPAARAYARGGV
jgi:hypothetical protein